MAIDKSVLDQAQKGFIRARLRLMNKNPFYAHLVMKMPLEWMEFEQPTGAEGLSMTDGKNIYINPALFVTLSKDEQVSTLVHEVLHCAAGHLFRCGPRDKVRWNIAGDVYIANLLEAESFAPVQGAEDFLKDVGINRGAFQNMPTEEIYNKLPSFPQQKQSGKSGANGHEHWNGQGCYKEPGTSAEKASGEQQWKQAVVEAAQQAGDKSGAWSELVKAAMPKPPFHLKLFEYLNRGIGGDSTFDAFNRRYIWQGLYLPADTKQVMGEIAVAVDTSGSMSAEQLKLAFGYIRAFRDQHPCKLHLIQCDYDAVGEGQYQVYAEHEVMPSEFKAVGRGGTSFDPPFKLMREKRVDPKVLIYLTDGYGSCSAKKPSYPVLWVILKGDSEWKQPFGEKVVVK